MQSKRGQITLKLSPGITKGDLKREKQLILQKNNIIKLRKQIEKCKNKNWKLPLKSC